MRIETFLAARTVTIGIDLDHRDLARLRDDETTSERRAELERLIGQTGAGPAQLVVELHLDSAEIRDLIRRALTNKSRSAQSLDKGLLARTRSWRLT